MRINKLLKYSRCSKWTAKRFPATQNTAINTSHCEISEYYLYSDSIMMLSVTNGISVGVWLSRGVRQWILTQVLKGC